MRLKQILKGHTTAILHVAIDSRHGHVLSLSKDMVRKKNEIVHKIDHNLLSLSLSLFSSWPPLSLPPSGSLLSVPRSSEFGTFRISFVSRAAIAVSRSSLTFPLPSTSTHSRVCYSSAPISLELLSRALTMNS